MENWLTSSPNRKLLTAVLVGLFLIGFGALYFKNGGSINKDKIEVLESTTEGQDSDLEVVVEIAGEVIHPGVYKLPKDSRVNDLLIVSGGLSAGADRVWVTQNLNRAAKLIDGQKIIIPSKTLGATSTLNNETAKTISLLININTADLKTLDSLPGIGPVYAQNIIENRPYSNTLEIVSKAGIPQKTYEKIKDLVGVY